MTRYSDWAAGEHRSSPALPVLPNRSFSVSPSGFHPVGVSRFWVPTTLPARVSDLRQAGDQQSTSRVGFQGQVLLLPCQPGGKIQHRNGSVINLDIDVIQRHARQRDGRGWKVQRSLWHPLLARFRRVAFLLSIATLISLAPDGDAQATAPQAIKPDGRMNFARIHRNARLLIADIF